MSMTVVCAAILSAICAPQLRREEKRIKNVNMCNYHMSQKYDSANGAVLSERGDLYGKKVRTEDFHDIFSKIANDLALDAFQSSVLCSSESSGQMSQGKILECTSCGFGICDTHTSLHQIESHNLKEVVISGKRANPHEFEMKIRCLAPSAIVLGKSWEESVSDCEGLESYSFQLQVRRAVYNSSAFHSRRDASLRVSFGNNLLIFPRITARGSNEGALAFDVWGMGRSWLWPSGCRDSGCSWATRKTRKEFRTRRLS